MTIWREGVITAGGTEYEIRLAPRPDAFRTFYRVVWPQAQDIPGAEGKVAGDPFVREWVIDRFAGGEGEDRWDPTHADRYDQSQDVRPKPVGDGLVLGARQIVTDHDGAATFTEGERFGLAHGLLWTVRDDSAHWWQPATNDWDQTGWTTGIAGADSTTSLIDQGDGARILIGHTDDSTTHAVRQVISGGNANVTGLTITASAGFAPVLRNWGGTLFHLNGDDLYSFTMVAAAATTTTRSQPGGWSNDWLTNGYQTANRISSSDKGPIWYQRLDNGQTLIHEYNVASQTTETVGKLQTDFAHPYSIFFAAGWYFVGFRYGDAHGQAGPAYIYYQRGSQRGQAGPIREQTAGTTASRAVLLAGMIGDDVVFYFDGSVWAYNITSGGINQVGFSTTSSVTTIREAITFGKSVFLSNHDNQAEVERFDTDAYTTTTSPAATWDSGRYDFGYPGVQKALLTVTVVTEPLTSADGHKVNLSVSKDGAAFAAVSGDHNTNGATSYTWTVSTSGTAVAADDFELRLTLTSTATTSTPVVRSITARSIGVEKKKVTQIIPDVGVVTGGVEGGQLTSAATLADLRTVVEYNGLVKLSHGWDRTEYDDRVDHEVVVSQARLTDSDDVGDTPMLEFTDVAYV